MPVAGPAVRIARAAARVRLGSSNHQRAIAKRNREMRRSATDREQTPYSGVDMCKSTLCGGPQKVTRASRGAFQRHRAPRASQRTQREHRTSTRRHAVNHPRVQGRTGGVSWAALCLSISPHEDEGNGLFTRDVPPQHHASAQVWVPNLGKSAGHCLNGEGTGIGPN